MLIKKCVPLILTLVFVFLSLAVQAIEFQLADKNLKDCINKLALKQKWQQATEVDDIKCHSKGIRSIQGLEQFTNLSKLSLYKNDIAELTLENFSKLEEINIARNKLQKMHLTQLPSLENLYFFGNQIKEVRLNDFPSLKQLKGNSSEIVIFEYDKLPKLEKIYLFDNQIENIDIYHLPAMNYMDVRQNPMSDELYEEMDRMQGMTILHDGNAEDWK